MRWQDRSSLRVLVIFVVALVGIRFLGERTRLRIGNGMSHAMTLVAFDDEMPALALPIVKILLWPYEKPVQLELWRKAIQSGRPNDLLIFAQTRYVAEHSLPFEARRLFMEQAGLLRVESCDRKYLVAALLPLAKKAGLVDATTDLGNLWDAYNLVGYRGVQGQDDCETLSAALSRYAPR
jgi:hypothetical protein